MHPLVQLLSVASPINHPLCPSGSHFRRSQCLFARIFSLSLFSFSHNWFVPHNELFILWKWFSGQASWSDMVIATSTGQNLPYRIPFSNYRGSNEERKDENNSQMMENLERVLSIFVDIVEQTDSIFFWSQFFWQLLKYWNWSHPPKCHTMTRWKYAFQLFIGLLLHDLPH